MRTLADIKRRIAVGVRLECTAQTYRPELIGQLRIVTKVKGNQFAWKRPTDGENSWTRWPKAREVKVIDADTFRMPIVNPWGVALAEHYVELKFQQT